jgi:peptidyl-tRNA hydrolase
MDAKDTILNPQDRVKFANVGDGIMTNNFRDDVPHWVISLLNKQTEQSFKAGIKEVVDWINNSDSSCQEYITQICFNKNDWESKLKEWGVK